MNEDLKRSSEFFITVCESAEAILDEYKFAENLQFPDLLEMVIARLSLDASLFKDADHFIRYHVRNHSKYHVSRGAKGGIMPKATHAKKLALKAAKDAAKQEIHSQLDAKFAPKENKE